LPSVAFTAFAGGSIRPWLARSERDAQLANIARDVGALLSRRERLELLVRLGFTRERASSLAARC